MKNKRPGLVLLRRSLMYGVMAVCVVIISQSDTFQSLDPRWLVKSSPHFLIHYERGSPAQRDIQELTALLEGHYEQLSRRYGFRIPEPIPYFFHDRELYSGLMPVWGYATDRSVHAIYAAEQKDTSPHELSHFFHRRINPGIPYFFNEGACGIGVEIGGEDFHSQVRRRCTAVFEFPLAALVEDFQRHGRFGDFLAYSFNSFLVEEFGEDQFAAFYRTADGTNWARKMEEIFGAPPAAIEQRWKTFLCGVR